MFNLNQIIKQVMGSVNPQQIIMQAAQRSPALQRAIQETNGKSPEQIREMAYGMAQNMGIDLKQLAQHMGIRLPE